MAQSTQKLKKNFFLFQIRNKMDESTEKYQTMEEMSSSHHGKRSEQQILMEEDTIPFIYHVAFNIVAMGAVAVGILGNT